MTHRVIVGVADPTARATIAFHLCLAGYHVVAGSDEHELLADVGTLKPALAILDVGPLQVLRGAEAFTDIPIAIVRDAEGRHARGGAPAQAGDDIIVDPADPERMLLRAASLIDRSKSGTAKGAPSATQTLGGLRLDRLRHEVTVNGTPIALTRAEFRILGILAARPGVVHTRLHLMTRLGVDDVHTSRGIDMHVLRLRGKLGAAKHMIETVRGFGYRLLEPPAESPGSESASGHRVLRSHAGS